MKTMRSPFGAHNGTRSPAASSTTSLFPTLSEALDRKRKQKQGGTSKHSKRPKPSTSRAKENDVPLVVFKSTEKTPRVSNRRTTRPTNTSSAAQKTPTLLRPKPSDSSGKHLRKLQKSLEDRRSRSSTPSVVTQVTKPRTNTTARADRVATTMQQKTQPATNESPPDNGMDCSPDDVSLSLDEVDPSPETVSGRKDKGSGSKSLHEPMRPLVTKGMLLRAREAEFDDKAVLKAMLQSGSQRTRSIDSGQPQLLSMVGTTIGGTQDCSASLDGSEVTLLSSEEPSANATTAGGAATMKHVPEIPISKLKAVDGTQACRVTQMTASGPNTQRVEAGATKPITVENAHVVRGVQVARDVVSRVSEVRRPSQGPEKHQEPSSTRQDILILQVKGQNLEHPVLPPGWTIHFSQSKQRLYYRHIDHGTTWHCPVVMPTLQPTAPPTAQSVFHSRVTDPTLHPSTTSVTREAGSTNSHGISASQSTSIHENRGFRSEEYAQGLVDILEASKTFEVEDVSLGDRASDMGTMQSEENGVVESQRARSAKPFERVAMLGGKSKDQRVDDGMRYARAEARQVEPSSEQFPTAPGRDSEPPTTDTAPEYATQPVYGDPAAALLEFLKGGRKMADTERLASVPIHHDSSPESFLNTDSPPEASNEQDFDVDANVSVKEVRRVSEEVVATSTLAKRGAKPIDEASCSGPVDKDSFEADVEGYVFDMPHSDIEISPHTKRSSPRKRASPDDCLGEESRHRWTKPRLSPAKFGELSPIKNKTPPTSPESQAPFSSPTDESPMQPTSPGNRSTSPSAGGTVIGPTHRKSRRSLSSSPDSLGGDSGPPQHDTSDEWARGPHDTGTVKPTSPDPSAGAACFNVALRQKGGRELQKNDTNVVGPSEGDSPLQSASPSTLGNESSVKNLSPTTSVATSLAGMSWNGVRPHRRRSSMRIVRPPHPLCSLMRLEEFFRRVALKKNPSKKSKKGQRKAEKRGEQTKKKPAATRRRLDF